MSVLFTVTKFNDFGPKTQKCFKYIESLLKGQLKHATISNRVSRLLNK